MPLGLVTLVLCGLVNLAVQQNYRMSANDPQIQIAEDVASAISAGKASPQDIATQPPTQDMTQSLYQFIEIYSATGTPIGGSVSLDGKLPVPPSGLFDAVRLRGEIRETWQPKTGVRIAAVMAKFTGAEPGFVLVGRSLKEVEARIQNLNYITLGALLASWILSYLLIVCLLKCVTKTDSSEVSVELSETIVVENKK